MNSKIKSSWAERDSESKWGGCVREGGKGKTDCERGRKTEGR